MSLDLNLCVCVGEEKEDGTKRHLICQNKESEKGPDVFRECVFSGQFCKILRGFSVSLYIENTEAQRWKIKPFFCLCLRDFSRYSETPAVEMNRGSFGVFFYSELHDPDICSGVHRCAE